MSRDGTPRGLPIVGVLAAALIALAAFNAWLIAVLQPPSGDGRRSETTEEFIGTLSRSPYPMLRRQENGGVRTYLLASSTKRGAEAVLGVTPNGPVRVTGHRIARASLSMIELDEDAVAVIAETQPLPEPPREVHGGTARLEGEIGDAKCWLGAMRPGEGSLHRACATLCIRGGIPPLFVSIGPAGRRAYLMTQADGRAIEADSIADYIGEPISLSGTVERRGDLWVFKADMTTIARLD
jgi:hypothetical protein